MNTQIDLATATQYYRSDAYRVDRSAILHNPVLATRATIKLLQHVALEPSEGLTVEAQLPGRARASVFVNLRTHRIVNLVGAFELDATTSEMQELRSAIRENLAGPMFRAAQISRRLDAKRSSREERWRAAAYEAWSRATDAANAACPRTHFQRTSSDIAPIVEAGRGARDAAHAPLKARYERRAASLMRQAAHSPLLAGCYSDFAAIFAWHYVRDASKHALASA